MGGHCGAHFSLGAAVPLAPRRTAPAQNDVVLSSILHNIPSSWQLRLN